MFKRSNSKGFTLIELLIVVAIIGIIAAIAIPNLLNAIQRGKQKRTMSDMRTVGTAVEQYSLDNGFRPENASGDAVTQLTDLVAPTFVKQVPSLDGWRSPIQWIHMAGDAEYSVASYGKDRTLNTVQLGATTSFASDLYFSDGSFTSYPEGTQN